MVDIVLSLYLSLCSVSPFLLVVLYLIRKHTHTRLITQDKKHDETIFRSAGLCRV